MSEKINNPANTPMSNDEAALFVKSTMQTLAQLLGPTLASFQATSSEPTPQQHGGHPMHSYESVSPTGVPITCYDPVGAVPNYHRDIDSFNRNPSLDNGHNQHTHIRPTQQRHPIGMEVGPRGVQTHLGYSGQNVTINPEIVNVAIDILNNLPQLNGDIGQITQLVSTCVNQGGVMTNYQANHPVMRNLHGLRHHLQAIARLANIVY